MNAVLDRADFRLIDLAASVVAAQAAYEASFLPFARTLAEERDRAPEQCRLGEVVEVHATSLADEPASTLAGVVAKALAALALVDRGTDGQAVARCASEHLALGALEDLVALADRDRPS